MPMTEKELAERDSKRDLGAELLQSVREMKGRQGRVVATVSVLPIIETRAKSGLSQAKFAKIIGVSVRTIQDWEQGRRNPSGAARVLLAIVGKHPEVLLDVGI